MTSSKATIVFAGTPNFAAQHLQALIDAGHNIAGVYTQPDRPAGRKKRLAPSAVKTVALNNNLPVYQPLNFKNKDDIDQLKALKPDILVVVAYGLILPQAVLDIPRLAPINVHASLLPRWRGAAPIERAIEAGDTQSGLGIMVMEAGLDTGPVLAEAHVNISENMTGDQLRHQLLSLGCEQLLACISQLVDGVAKAIPQATTGVCYAHKLQRDETAIDWSQSADALHNKVRAFNSSNVATFTVNETRVKLWLSHISPLQSQTTAGTIVSLDDKFIHVQCGNGVLALSQLQLPGKKALASADILNGKASLFAIGAVLS